MPLFVLVGRALCVLIVSCVALGAAGTGTALATTVALSPDGRTLIVDGDDDADHDIRFRLSANGANDVIVDMAGFTAIPKECAFVPSYPHDDVSCPGRPDVQIFLGSGHDEVEFFDDCFADYYIDLGDGENKLHLGRDCEPSPTVRVNVVSGSGSDSLTAGSLGPVTFVAGDGDDTLTGGVGDDVLYGGDGADVLEGNDGDDQLLGEGGSDTLNGGSGDDLVDGGDDDDALDLCSRCGHESVDTGTGADTYVGGPGTDVLWLAHHRGGVSVSLDGAANDGEGGENDNVGSDIETIEGSPGNDVFTGGAGNDTFEGNSGNDTLHGGEGDDGLIGGAGDDMLRGGDGADDLIGTEGDDKLYGDAGNDKLQGQGGQDTIDGGAGTDALYGDVAGCRDLFCGGAAIDVLLARDGERDTVDCGGAGNAKIDTVDAVKFCSSVDRPAVVTPTPPSPPSPCCARPQPGFAFSFAATKLSIARGAGTTVKCPVACRFTASLVLSAKVARNYGLGRKSLTIGSARGAVPAGGSRTVTLKLSTTARRKLKRARRVPATLKVIAQGAAGPATTNTRAITLGR